jgi:hypothetical protein
MRQPSPRSSKASRPSKSSSPSGKGIDRVRPVEILPLAAEPDLRYSLQWESIASVSASSFVRPSAEALRRSLESLVVKLFYPVHPGIAKQVMEPATLWFERRARRVKRATSGKLLTPRPGLIGRRLSSVSVATHSRPSFSRSPGRLSRRAHSPSLAIFSTPTAVRRCTSAPLGFCSRLRLVQIMHILRRAGHAIPRFPPRKMLRWGSSPRASGVVSARRGDTRTGAQRVQ